MASNFEISYKATFIRRFNKLDKELQEEVIKALDLLSDKKNHKQLRVHKLTGKLKNLYSCSVNFSYRVVFLMNRKGEITIMDVGDHDVYK